MDSITKLRRFYDQTPDSPIYQQEFGYYSLETWIEQGHIAPDTDLDALFLFDAPAKHSLRGLGWCEAAFSPEFEVAVLEDRGDYELVRDVAGRSVLYFKNRRDGFMPEYVDHPVKDMTTWQAVKERLNPDDPERYKDLHERMADAADAAARGQIVCQQVIGGYMYLRSLIGPEALLYMFYDDPKLIHDCMKAWLALADGVIAAHQRHAALDELFLAEDICYNHGSLISHDMIRRFLFPYYRELIEGVRARRKDGRILHIQIDTDGNAIPVIDLYKEIGMDYMSPFEAASGCDVVAVRRRYPDLLIRGGFDKRILARGRDAIDRETDRIMPFMKRQDGYIPTCDHGVPAEVRFEDYMHFRRRMAEYGK